MEHTKKRKRDADCPRITYHTSTRTFDRLFRENSLAEMKEVARRKLGLEASTSILFAQMREGKTVDLEDDDDFDAFYSLAHATNSVDVQVTIGERQDEAILPAPMTPKKNKRRKRNTTEISEPDENPKLGAEARNPVAQIRDADVANEPRKKKRKADSSAALVGAEIAGGTSEASLQLASSVVPSDPPTLDKSLIPVTVYIEQHDSKKERKKRRRKERADEVEVRGPSSPKVANTTLPPSEPKSAKRKRSKEIQGPSSAKDLEKLSETQLQSGMPVKIPEGGQDKKQKSRKSLTGVNSEKADDLPSISLKTSATRSLPKPQESSTKESEVQEQNGKEGGLSAKKPKKESRTLTSDERKAAEADVDAIFAKVLAAKRAAAASVSVAPTENQDDVAPSAKSKKKKKKTDQPIQPENDRIQEIVKIADSLKPVARSHPEPQVESSCPFCLLSPLHEKETCPLVLGGSESLKKRLSELEESSDDGRGERAKIIGELRELLQLVEKENEEAEIGIDSQNRGAATATNFMNSASQSISSKKAISSSSLTSKPVATKPTPESSDTSSDESSDEEKPDHADHAIEFLSVSNDPAFLANIDLNDLIRGPGAPALRIADIQSPDSSDEEQEEQETYLLEEDEVEVPRRSRKSALPDSSDDADSGLDEIQSITDEPYGPPSADASPPREVLSSFDTDHVSFRAVDRIGESEEVDRSADAAFGAALELDAAVWNLAGASQDDTLLGPATKTDLSSPIQVDRDKSLEVISPNRASTPALSVGALSTQPLQSTPMTSLRDSPPEADTQDDKPVGLVQRIKTRNAKTPSGDINLNTSTMSETPRTGLALPSQDAPDSTVRRTRSTTRLQALSTITPPILPAKLGRQSRLIRPPDASHSIEEAIYHSTAQDSTSLDTWATLKASSPTPDADATMMVDELEPSSPLPHTHIGLDNLDENGTQDGPAEDPLFIPSESLPPFPYSQWNDASQKEVDVSVHDEPNEEVELPVQPPPRIARQSQSRYRRLTDITGDHGLFSTPTNTRATRSSAAAKKLTDMYGKSGKDEIETESEPESDNSDAQEKSHIPKARMAGARQAKRK